MLKKDIDLQIGRTGMEDRRIRKSRAALKEALLILMQKKKFTSITVKELCEQADVNRSTFYNNYSDMRELLTDIHWEVFDEMSDGINMERLTSEQNRKDIYRKDMEEIIAYFKRKRKLFILFLQNDDEQLFENNMVRYYFHKFGFLDSEDSEKYPFLYNMTGSFTLICGWLLKGCCMPEEELAEMLCRLNTCR